MCVCFFFFTFILLSVLVLLTCFFSFPAELSGLLFIGDGILQVEMPELRLMLVYAPHPTLQKITNAVSLIIHVATCPQKLRPYTQMSHPRSFIGYKYIRQKKKKISSHISSLPARVMPRKHLRDSQRRSVFMATVDVTLLFTAFSADAITVIVLASLIILKMELQ